MSDPYDPSNAHAQAAQIASDISARSGGGDSGNAEHIINGEPPELESNRLPDAPSQGRNAELDTGIKNSYPAGSSTLDSGFRAFGQASSKPLAKLPGETDD